MKKITVLLALLITLSGLFASSSTPKVITKSIPIQGAFGQVAHIAVETIPAMANAYMHGIPFNIEEPYVWYGSGEGRQVAYWSFISNTAFEIEITAEPMKYADTGLADDIVPLEYVLYFSCMPSYINAEGTSVTNAQYSFTVESGKTTRWTEFNNVENTSSYIGSVNGSIYFQFNERSTNRIKLTENFNKNNRSDLPAGSYVAQVTMKILIE